MEFEWYLDFVDLNYRPDPDELVCTFLVHPSEGITIEEAAGRVASESSVGTWTTLASLPDRIKKLMAKVFLIDGNMVKVSYPLELFEPGNLPQLLSSIAGNIFGMRAIRNLRLLDIEFPHDYVKNFSGAKYGIPGIREILKIDDRPLLATVPKPKLGFDVHEYADVAYQALCGGLDMVKDDENLTNQSFIKFEERLESVMKVLDLAEKETGERKTYLVNITAETEEMVRRAKLVSDFGNEYVMVDFLTSGFSALQTLRKKCEELNLAIHAHRAMHAAFTRSKVHGISLRVLVKLLRIVGVDNVHVGSGVGKMVGELEEVLELVKICRDAWYDLRPIFPVSSGGLHPGLVPDLINKFGKDVIIQAGGGVHGHPDGTFSGARAFREAVDLTLSGMDLEEGGKELRKALEKWGKIRPR